MAKKALLIGINYANTPNELRGCIDDIVNMRNALIDAYSYSPGNIVMLRDDQPLQPTRSNILAQLAALVQQSGQLQEIWVHYSGHGSYVADKNGDEIATRQDSTIVPCDYMTTGVIVDDELIALLKRVKPSCRVILLFDSCFSGSVCDLPWSFEHISGNKFSRSLVDRVVLAHPNMYMMSGCKDTQMSAEVYVGKEYAGAFTNAFLECLRASGHNINILALYRAVCQYLLQQGHQQKPLFSSSNFMPTAAALTRTITASAAPAVAVAASTATKKMLMQY